MIEDCKFFGQNLANTSALMAEALLYNKKKSREKKQKDEPAECAS